MRRAAFGLGSTADLSSAPLFELRGEVLHRLFDRLLVERAGLVFEDEARGRRPLRMCLFFVVVLAETKGY